MPDWDRCRTDLYWSANHEIGNWRRHGEALMDKATPDREEDGFETLCDIQDHNQPVQDNYRDCRTQDLQRFWDVAQDVWYRNGPRLDV